MYTQQNEYFSFRNLSNGIYIFFLAGNSFLLSKSAGYNEKKKNKRLKNRSEGNVSNQENFRKTLVVYSLVDNSSYDKRFRKFEIMDSTPYDYSF